MVRFLHVSDTPISEWKDSAGRPLPRVAKPPGFWIARDLTWVALMDQARAWTPRPDKQMPGREAPGRILAAVSHVVAGTPLPRTAEEEAVRSTGWSPLYVYELDLPPSAFSTDLTTPTRAHIFQLSRATLDAFLAAYDAFRRKWAATEGPGHPSVRDAIKRSLMKSVDSTPEDLARTKQIRDLVKKPKGPAYAIVDSSADVTTLLLALFDGTLTLRDSREIAVAVWRDFLTRLQTQWGGLEFLPDLFTSEGDDPALVARVELLRRLDVPSAVLFSVPSVLGPAPPSSYLRGILTGLEGAVSGGPVYRFGVTESGDLRVVDPSGGRRRRTRRRVLKNPKTLKKRIR